MITAAPFHIIKLLYQFGYLHNNIAYKYNRIFVYVLHNTSQCFVKGILHI